MAKGSIKLPITDKGEPDWNFMEEYVKPIKYLNSLAN